MKKAILAVCLVACSAPAIAASTTTAISTETFSRLSFYSVDLKTTRWYQKPMVVAAGAYWSEMTLWTIFDAKSGKVIEVNAVPSNTNPYYFTDEQIQWAHLIFRLSSRDQRDSFLAYLFGKTTFHASEVPKLLDLYNYLYDNRTETLQFDSQNLFDDGGGTMHGKFSKKTDGDKTIISVETKNGSGSPNGWVEITMSPGPKKHIEKIVAKIKIGITITLSLRPQEAKDN
ncbi:MAG: hypothetical protein KGI60_01855 [Patescibacteria group bacterium]|nr:hypothetical protein [Patescibacteria group bacterium]